MNLSAIGSILPEIQADAIPLEKLAQSDRLSEPAKIREVSRQFEALLVRQILKETRKPVIESGLFGQSFSSDLYQDMINDKLAETISQSGAMGLAAQLERDLGKRYLNPPPTKGESSDE